MNDKDFFHRRRLLPKRLPSSTPQVRGSKSEQARSEHDSAASADEKPHVPDETPDAPDFDGEGDSVAAVFERPTMVPRISPDILAARAMQQQSDAERATTARAPCLPAESNDEGEHDDRVTLSTEHVPLGERALVRAHRSVNRAVSPPPNIARRNPGSSTSTTKVDISHVSDPADSGASALGFVDSLPRSTGQPPAVEGTRKPNQPAVAAGSRSLTDMYAVGDFSGALKEAERRLEANPSDGEAQRYAQDCRRVLVKMQLTRLGSLQQIVHLAVAPERLQWLSIDHRAGFLLSLVDGHSTLEDLLDISGMPRLEALHLFAELNDQGVIVLKPLSS